MASKTVTTILKLKDEMSSKMKKMQETSATACASVQQKAQLVGKQWEATGKKVSKVGTTLTKGVTAPIMAVGAASFAAWKEVDDGMDTVIQKTGATGEAAKELQKSVENIATSIPTSFAEAGEAVGEVNTRFGLTGDALDELSTKFIKFSSLNGTDLTSTIDSMQSAMASFGVETDQAGEFLDTINKAAQDTGVDVLTLADSMQSNAASLKDMGFSASDAAMFLANMDKNGVDASAAMTALKKGLVTATQDGKSMGEAMAELQNTIKNAPTDTEAYAAAIEMFGSRSGTAIANAVREGRMSFDELGTSMSDFSGNVDSTFEEMKDPVDDFQQNLNKVKLIGADIAETAMPMIADALQIVSDILNKVKGAWDGLSDSQKENIVKIAGIAAAVGPILAVIGKVITVIGVIIPKIVTVVSIVTKVISVLKVVVMVIGVITGLPAIAVAAIIAAVVVVVALIIKFRKQIAEFFVNIWNKIKEFGANIKAKAIEIVQNIKDKVQEIKDKFAEFKEHVVQKFKEIGEGIKEKLLAPFEWISEKLEAFKEGVGKVVDKVKDTASNVKAKVTGGADRNATGTQYYTGGRTWVGEDGPELVDLPKGSKVYPHGKSQNMAQPSPIINLSLNIQGNVIGNDDFANMLSERITGNIVTAMANA